MVEQQITRKLFSDTKFITAIDELWRYPAIKTCICILECLYHKSQQAHNYNASETKNEDGCCSLDLNVGAEPVVYE